MLFMQIESVLQTKNRSEPAKKSVFCSPGNDHKFLDRQVWANSADPDQTAPRGV